MERLYLIIDAVDESDEEDRRNILQLLFDLCSEPKDCIVKVFVASRPEPKLDYRIKDSHNFIRLQDETTHDISRFVHSFLNLLNPTAGFLERATEYIVKYAQGVFLWVQLVKEELQDFVEQGSTEEDIFEFLRSLPTELEEFYKRILEKLGKKESDLRDGIKMFRFILFARRPLTVAELRHTLGIQDNPETEFTLSDEDFQRRIPAQPVIVPSSYTVEGRRRIDPMGQRIIHCGGNFLEIKQNHGTNASYKETASSIANNPVGSSSVQVMHSTVREFFLRPNGCVANSKFKMSEKDAHISISITCIRYLMLCVANTTLANKLPDIKSWTSKHFELYAQYLNEKPLINYVLCHLKHHIDGSCQAVYILRFVSQFVEELTDNPAAYLLESWVSTHLNKTLPGHELGEAAKDFRNRLLHVAVRMRFPGVAEVLLIASAQVEAQLQGKTPLIVSAEIGDDTMVKLLREKGAELENKSNSGQTPLSWAARNGHEAVVKLLLEKGAVLETKDSYYRTPLSWAAENGHEAVVKLLLEKGAELETMDDHGQTPLSRAARSGHEAVVKLLLEKGAELETKSINGQTPLSRAAENGHEAVVKLLLEKGAELETKSNICQTPLSRAAENGHEAVVKLLLEKGAELETKSNRGRTPLSWAAENGHEAAVKLLLEKGAELEYKSNRGRTPLSWAAENGHEAVVKLLLEKGAELKTKSNSGQTPLSWAAGNGHEAVVKLLLEKGAELETKDYPGQTPLLRAARSGHEAVVKLLLEKGAELETKDDYGQMPLSWAAENGHEAVVELLLERGAELETKDDYGQTPLSWAARNGHEAIVKLLLEKGAELETKSNNGQTPLSWAAENGHEAVVKLLLEKGAKKPQ